MLCYKSRFKLHSISFIYPESELKMLKGEILISKHTSIILCNIFIIYLFVYVC